MLVSLADMKTYLGISSGNTTHDALLTQQITVISDAIESYCNRKFEQANYVQTFYKDEMMENDYVLDTLTLYHFPLISVTSVLAKQDELDVGTALTNYRINKPTSRIINKDYCNLFSNAQLIEVSYTAGFVVIPSVIQNAVYSLVQERYNRHIAGVDLNFGSNVQSVSIPGTISIAYDYSLDENSRGTAFGAILGKYVNTLDYFRSERSVVGDLRLAYL